MTGKQKKQVVRTMFKFHKLNDFEKKFVQSLYVIREGKFDLTEKQKKVLEGIYLKIKKLK